MLRLRSLLFFLLTSILLVSSLPVSFPPGEESLCLTYQTGESGVVALSWSRTERLLADNYSSEEPVDSTAGLVLAPRRTYRKDPLNDFKRYTGGWNISNRHYWASVGYTAAPLFVIATTWFVIFGLCFSLICFCHCCPPPREPSDACSQLVYAFSLILLIFLSIAAIVGCAVLYTGQEKFHTRTINALEYVVHQADATSDSLRSVSEYLSAAKQINVDQVSLPPNAQTDIEQTQTSIDSSATTLANTTRSSSKRIKNLLESVRLAVIIITALMLLLTLLGLAFSILGMQFPVYILVITGWILVTGAFLLCGIFLLLHNVTGDTCVAMHQWVQSPTASHTALDDILACVDNGTVQETLSRTKQVTSQLVDSINTVISNVSNINFAPNFAPMYYNQSGPLVPGLCNPFNPDQTSRACSPGEVDLNNATRAWSGYVCQTPPSPSPSPSPSPTPTPNGNNICVTTGRLTPSLYGQMAAVVNLSNALYQVAGPVMGELEDCSFVRQTFLDVDASYCPAIRKYSRRIYLGLLTVGTAVMLSLLFWVMYGRERRRRLDAPRGDVIIKGGEDHGKQHTGQTQ